MILIPRERLVLTDDRDEWHVMQPASPWYALCGVKTRPPLGDRPTSGDPCRHCVDTYRREVVL